MTVEELKSRAAERIARINNPIVGDDEAVAHVRNMVDDAMEFRVRDRTPPGALPAFDWTVIIQIVLPIILAWIERRFPRPVPVPVPVPDPVNPTR